MKRFLLSAIWLIFISAGCTSSVVQNSESESAEKGSGPLLALIRKHREEYTKYDGPRCPMYPSCSAYAEKAIRQDGIYGFALFLNRLIFSETGNLAEKFIPVPSRMSKDIRYFDPYEDSIPGRRPSLLKEDFSE